ncbi:uncharacterized protein LOC128735566 [Sabethes cyaneus]|uniref:uncharacterized protein LOC128735566 n=1 Tax=Sabethes cyaneus TaxID=53552 RepID=UPI00237EBDE7|nr:uncharacterized protein LOC128735566 [Sabethes cyaneus]
MAKELRISQSTMKNILEDDLRLILCIKQRVHGFTEKQKVASVERCRRLHKRHGDCEILFPGKKTFLPQHHHNQQNDWIFAAHLCAIPWDELAVQRFQNVSNVMLALAAVAQALSIDDRGLDININVEKSSNLYHHGRVSSFEYGLDVVKQVDNHFQHKVKGEDGVTYGCYGFVDPDGKPHLVHYVSDLKGYRVVPPDHATKIYISRLEKSINNVYQASIEKDVQWKDLFFPPACRTLRAELEKLAPVTTRRPTTPRPTTPRPTTTARTTTTPRPTTAAPIEPEFGDSSNLHEAFAPNQDSGSCSRVCDALRVELQDIKSKLKTLIDSLSDKKEQRVRPISGNSSYAYFPVLLSDSPPAGFDGRSGKYALPVFAQCGN